nr:TonB-dependent receptor [Sphingomonas sp. CDS-1]
MQGSKSLMRLGVSAFPLVLICMAASPAVAEENTQARAGASEKSSDSARGKAAIVLEDIVVTARRRAESLQTVPLSVTAISAEMLVAEGVKNIIDLQFHTPELTVVGGGGNRNQVTYAMRGQTQAYGGALPGVASYFADMPIINQASPPFLDLQNVQVLKGPQGTLFGRNTTGGAVLFAPQRPTSELDGYVMLKAGNYNLRHAEGAVNIPIVPDVLAVRFAGQRIKRDGYTLNLTTGKHRDNVNSYAYRGSVLFTPSGGFSDYLVVDGSGADDSGGTFMMNAVRPNSIVALVYPDIVQYVQTQNARGPRIIESDVTTSNRQHQLIVVNTATYEFTPNFSIKDIFGYQRFSQKLVTDQDGSPFNILWFPLQVHTKLITNEIQALGTALDGKLNIIAGFYYEKSSPSGSNSSQARVFGGPFPSSASRHETSKAIYGQATYDLGDLLSGLKLTAGGRYTWDYRQYADLLAGTPPLTARFTAPTYNFSLDYRINPNLFVYAATRRGYKSGGFNPTSPVPELAKFQPEYITDYEVGVKADWRIADVAGRTNLTLYTGNYTDVQKSQTVSVNGELVGATLNAAKGTVRGVDFETTVNPTTWLNLSAFYSYTDAFYKKFPSSEGNAVDSEFSNTPKTKIGLTGEIKAPLSDEDSAVSFRASYYHQSHQYLWDLNFNNPESRAPGYDLVNLRAEWSRIGGKPLSLALFGSNILNAKYVQQGNPLATVLGFNSVAYGDPRMYGAELRFEF